MAAFRAHQVGVVQMVTASEREVMAAGCSERCGADICELLLGARVRAAMFKQL